MFKHFGFGRRRSTTTKTINVVTLDGNTLPLQVESRSPGSDVLDRALEICCVHSEREYFGLVATDAPFTKWLNLNKPIKKQLAGRSPYGVHLRIKLYPRDHHNLLHPTTRHNLYLQVKQDIQLSRLECSNLSLLHRLAALIVQSEIGDFSGQTCGAGYITDLNILPQLTNSAEEAISQLHRLHRGRSSQDCEEELLDLAQDEPTYGSVSYNVQDSAKQTTLLCICPIGVKVQQANAVIAFHEWESIVKIASRGKSVSYHISATHTLLAYQCQFTCSSTDMASNVMTWSQALHNFYCKSNLTGENSQNRRKSRLKRFFSSRRSLRRRPLISNPMPNATGQASRPRSGSHAAGRRSSMELKTASRTSLWSAPARSDSKLVIYGASGIASPAHSTTATPTHRVETTPIHLIDATPTSLDVISEDMRYSSYDTTIGSGSIVEGIRVGSVADVEHKSITALINDRRRRSSGGQSLNHEHKTSSRVSVELHHHHDDQLHHQGDSMWKSEGCIQSQEYGRGSYSGQRNRVGDASSPHKSSTEHVHRISNSDSPYRSSTEHVQKRLSSSGSHRSSREFVIRRVSGDYSKRTSEDNIHHRQESLGKTTPTRPHPQYQNVTPQLKQSPLDKRGYHGNHYPTNGSCSPARPAPWYERQEDLKSEAERLPNKEQTVYHEERWYQDERYNGYRGNGGDHTHHKWNGHAHNRQPYRKLSHDRSPDPQQLNGEFERKSKSRSLPRDVTPERVEEEEGEENIKKRVVDPNHPARPKNRGPFRLSLQDSTFYDTTRQYRGGSARWPRHSTVTVSTASLSQPSDLLGGISSKLGSIASLEYQASLAELSQAESFIDPHTRSFIFEGSQTNSQGTEL